MRDVALLSSSFCGYGVIVLREGGVVLVVGWKAHAGGH